MTGASALAAALGASLGPAMTPNLTSADKAHDLYEAYIFTLVLRAARHENFAVAYESITPGPAGAFTFRTGPGHIHTTMQPYSYAVLSAPTGLEFEAHVGVRVVGKSKVTHECDVLLLDRAEAVTCRARRHDPRHTKARLAVECKFYSASLGLGELRSFIGLTADIARPTIRLVSNVSSNSMARLFKSHRRLWEDYLTPGSLAEERFLGDISSELHRLQSQ